MSARAILAFALAFAGASMIAAPASAGCGDSSDSSDGGDSSSCPIDWSYDDDGGSGSSRPLPRCVEVSDTLGESQCRRYGQGWNRRGAPSVRFSLGPAMRFVRLGGVAFGGRTTHHEQSYAIGSGAHGLDSPDVVVGGPMLRLDFTVADWVSLGAEVAIAGADVSGPTRTDGRVRVTPTGLFAFDAGAVVGVGLPVDIVTFRPEVYAGIRLLALSSVTQLDDCVDLASSAEVVPVLEARLGVELFLSNHVGLIATVGTNVLNPGEMHGALTLSFHSRAFDGQPR